MGRIRGGTGGDLAVPRRERKPGWGRALWRGVLPLALLTAPLAGQAGPSYHPLQLDGARYQQQIRSTITLEGGRLRSRETGLREGELALRAEWRDSVIAVEAWFDSLVAWREAGGTRVEPETDGVIGGRFHGLLSPSGGFTLTESPFVPDDLAEITELAGALGDLLPPLPGRRLAPGESWRDPFGAAFLRVPDETVRGRRVERYRLVRTTEREEVRLLPDSSAVRAWRVERETGVFSWSPELGVVRWERDVTVEVTVPEGGVVKEPFRTRIEQAVLVRRL